MVTILIVTTIFSIIYSVNSYILHKKYKSKTEKHLKNLYFELNSTNNELYKSNEALDYINPERIITVYTDYKEVLYKKEEVIKSLQQNFPKVLDNLGKPFYYLNSEDNKKHYVAYVGFNKDNAFKMLSSNKKEIKLEEITFDVEEKIDLIKKDLQ